MSTATSAPMTLDVSQTARVPFTRLVSVELRKMFDTRAGRWLLISIAAFTALVLIIQLWVVLAQDQTVTFEDFAAGANIPMNILLPVLGVMSVTSEWSQRTAMVTFTLEPSRTRFLAAKFVGTLIIALAAVVVGFTLTIAANGLYAAFSDNPVTWDLGPFRIFCFFLLYVFSMATGFAFGMLLLNTAAAIVVYFVYSVHLPRPLRAGLGPDGLVQGPAPVDRLRERPEPHHRGRRDRQGVGAVGGVRLHLAGPAAGHRGVAGAAGRGQVTP